MTPDARRERILRHALLDIGADPAPGPLVLPLPAVGMDVVAEVEHASLVGLHRFSRIALATTDGAVDPHPGPDELAAALRTELAARGGPEPVPPGPVPAAADGPAPEHGPAGGPPEPVGGTDPVAVALALLHHEAGRVSDADLTDRVLVSGLLPLVGATGPAARPERSQLAALAERLAAARDAERPGRVRRLLHQWLTAAHLWRRPVLHPAPWHRTPNSLRRAGAPAVTDPPVPGRAGEYRLRPARPHGADLRTVGDWMRRPEVVRFFGQPWPDERWARELDGHGAGSGTAAVLVEPAGDPAAGPIAYLEIYRPVRHALARAFPVGPGDVGVHVCVGAAHRRGTGGALLAAVAEALTAAGCPRVLAEPDARNTAARRAFGRAGFDEAERIALPHKDAVVMVRTAA